MASCSKGRELPQDFVSYLGCEPMAASLRDGGEILCETAKELEHRGPGICVFPLTSFSASHFIPFDDERVLWRDMWNLDSSLLCMDLIPLNCDSIIKAQSD